VNGVVKLPLKKEEEELEGSWFVKNVRMHGMSNLKMGGFGDD